MGASVTRTDNVARLLLTSMLSLALVAAAGAQSARSANSEPRRGLGPQARNAGGADAERLWRICLRHQWRAAVTAAVRLEATFGRCRREPSGLREVYFRYDDELEYWAKANELPTEIERYSGTKVYDFPVVLSALFDDGGTLAGLRIVSDPRDTSRSRDEAYALRNFLSARFGREGWSCNDLQAAEGEEPVEGTFIKQDCRKTVDGRELAVMQTRYFRKKGQHQFDPYSKQRNQG